ncbi:MAG: hypothetical protein M3O46_23535 [Myxococcota bacterium]|nr:hypothetical protein [Myxococcota bacterium]
MAMAGVPARTVQELARHTDLSTTMRYMHLSPNAKERRASTRSSAPASRVAPPWQALPKCCPKGRKKNDPAEKQPDRGRGAGNRTLSKRHFVNRRCRSFFVDRARDSKAFSAE